MGQSSSSTDTAIGPTDRTLLAARQALYRFLAATLADPLSGNRTLLLDPSTRELVTSAAWLVREEAGARQLELGLGELPIARLDPADVLAAVPASDHEHLAVYQQAFGLVVCGTCPPCETEYIDGKLTFQRSHALADVAGFYRAFGLRPAREHPERQDHIVLELEFMAFILGLELCADEAERNEAEQNQTTVNNDAGAHRAICRQAQKRFFAEHLAWWVPTFARLLEHEDANGSYVKVAALLAAFIPAERAILGVEARQEPMAPSGVEAPDACEGCELHDIT
jgi:TorA maturation chaperone TorD